MSNQRKIFTILIAVGGLCIAGHSGGVMAGDKSAPVVKESKSAEGAAAYPVICHLKKRDRVITIRTGPDGPLYTVETKDGKTLAVNVSAEELCAEFPDLKNVIEKGMAVDDAAYRPN